MSFHECTHFRQEHLEAVLAHHLAGRMTAAHLIQDLVPARDIVAIYERLRDAPGSLFGTVFDWGSP